MLVALLTHTEHLLMNSCHLWHRSTKLHIGSLRTPAKTDITIATDNSFTVLLIYFPEPASIASKTGILLSSNSAFTDLNQHGFTVNSPKETRNRHRLLLDSFHITLLKVIHHKSYSYSPPGPVGPSPAAGAFTRLRAKLLFCRLLEPAVMLTPILPRAPRSASSAMMELFS